MASPPHRRFRRRKFQTLAELPVKALGLSATRTRELRLHRAWTQVAGAKLAGQAHPAIRRGGCLELTLADSDPVWARTLLEIGASIALELGRLSGEKVRLVRVLLANGTMVGEREPLPQESPASGESTSSSATRPEVQTARPYDEERLRSLMVRYLARFESSATGGGSSDD